MGDSLPRVIAVDWSGKKKDAAEFIWLAEASNGQIAQLENGFHPESLIAMLIGIADRYPKVIAGFDFAFSMPAWYLMHHAAIAAPDFWEIVASEGETWLAECPWPFYGPKGTKMPTDYQMRRDTEVVSGSAKSTFLINAPGAVAVGSIRGMPLLTKLREAGWKVWPFDPPGYPLAVEIYPRLLTGEVVKTVWRKRLEYLIKHFPALDPRYAERAAGCEDAFDAAVSALVMNSHLDALMNLPDLTGSVNDRLEGRIWSP